MLENIDKRALKLLLKYDILAEEYKREKAPLSQQQIDYVDEYGTSPENFEYMKEKGLAFDCIDLNHDEAVSACFEYFRILSKKSVTDSFLASLKSAPISYRSGLSAYAIMQSMPRHQYVENAAGFCEICSGKKYYHCLDITHLNYERHKYGSMIGFRTPYEIQFFLGQQMKLQSVKPTSEDFDVFNSILAELFNAGDKCKPIELRKILKAIPGFAATADQCTSLLETLGFCSILESGEHKGYLSKYTNPGLAPSKSRSSDWAYPVDFWTGHDGVNKDALNFWFGEYKEVNLV
jgi:hypothetical protein